MVFCSGFKERLLPDSHERGGQRKNCFYLVKPFYQFERMPQGITGAPATFQRLMAKAVGDMNLLQVLVYLDDLIIFGKSLVEYEE